MYMFILRILNCKIKAIFLQIFLHKRTKHEKKCAQHVHLSRCEWCGINKILLLAYICTNFIHL